MKITIDIKTALPEDKARGLLLATLTTVMKSLKNNDARPLKFLLGERLRERVDRRALNAILWQITRELSKGDEKLKAHNRKVKDQLIVGKPKPAPKKPVKADSNPELQRTEPVSVASTVSLKRNRASQRGRVIPVTSVEREIWIPD